MALPANNNVVGYLQAGSYTAQQDRLISAVLSQRGNALGHGVIFSDWSGTGSKNLETTAPGGMNLSVAPGYAMVSGYSVYVPAATALTVAAATATARRDLVILHVYDVEKGDADNGAMVEIVKGTTTSDPVVPVGSLLLAQIDVAANAVSISNANITNRRIFTAAAGGTPLLPDPVITDIQGQQVALGSFAYNSYSGQTYQQRGIGAAGLTPFNFNPAAYRGGVLKGALPADKRSAEIHYDYGVISTDSGGHINMTTGFSTALCFVAAFSVDNIWLTCNFDANVQLGGPDYATIKVIYTNTGQVVASAPIRISAMFIGIP